MPQVLGKCRVESSLPSAHQTTRLGVGLCPFEKGVSVHREVPRNEKEMEEWQLRNSWCMKDSVLEARLVWMLEK